LTDALVELRVYHKDDKSLVDYFTNAPDDFDNLDKDSRQVREYSRFHNQHYELVTKIDEKVTKSGNGPPGVSKEDEFKDMIDELNDFIDLKSMLSLAKQKKYLYDTDAEDMEATTKSCGQKRMKKDSILNLEQLCSEQNQMSPKDQAYQQYKNQIFYKNTDPSSSIGNIYMPKNSSDSMRVNMPFEAQQPRLISFD